MKPSHVFLGDSWKEMCSLKLIINESLENV